MINPLNMQDEDFQQNAKEPVVLDALHFKNNYNTQLNPKEEEQYQSWVNSKKDLDPAHADSDYDMRGFWKSGLQQQDNGHYTDQFKKPNHPTFSNESQYHGTTDPNGEPYAGGEWTKLNSGRFVFSPSERMSANPEYVKFMQNTYFPKAEPNNVFFVKEK